MRSRRSFFAASRTTRPPCIFARGLSRTLGHAEPADALLGRAVERFPLAVELHLLHAIVLSELDRSTPAVRAARRAVYLKPQLEVAHYLLGTLLQRAGDSRAACKSFETARRLCLRRDENEILEHSDGERAGRLAWAAEIQLELCMEEADR